MKSQSLLLASGYILSFFFFSFFFFNFWAESVSLVPWLLGPFQQKVLQQSNVSFQLFMDFNILSLRIVNSNLRPKISSGSVS